jgi:serine/threonine protein kinase
VNKKTKKQLVVKFIECFNDDEAEECYQEISFMDRLTSPFIVSLDSNFLDGDSIFIVMEYCANGDLSNLIKKCKTSKTLVPEWVFFFFFFFNTFC